MDGFTPINSQEEFDAAIKSRLERERATISKQYADYDQLKSNAEKFAAERASWEKSAEENAQKIKDLNDQLTASAAKAKAYELDNLRTQVAVEKGIPMEIRNRLSGETKEEIEKDADSLAMLFKVQNNKDLPQFEPHNEPTNDEKEEYKKLLKKIKGE